MLRWAVGIPAEHSDTEAFRFRMLRWAVGIPSEHSDFKCSDGHWAFHRIIQVSNAQKDNWHSTGAFRFRMRRWALGISPGEHSDFKCSDGHWAFHPCILILNVRMGIGHTRWILAIRNLNAPVECPMPI